MLFLFYLVYAPDTNPITKSHATPFNAEELQIEKFVEDAGEYMQKLAKKAKLFLAELKEYSTLAEKAIIKVKNEKKAYEQKIQEGELLEYESAESKNYIDAIMQCEKAKINYNKKLKSILSDIQNVDSPELESPLITENQESELIQSFKSNLQLAKVQLVKLLDFECNKNKKIFEKVYNEYHKNIFDSFYTWLETNPTEQKITKLEGSMTLLNYLEELKEGDSIGKFE